jgi:hypothetical protein
MANDTEILTMTLTNNRVLSIGKLEIGDGGRWVVHMQNGQGSWFLANPEEIPSSKLDDCEYHLFTYVESDQFCKYVDLYKLQESAQEALAGDPDAAGDFLRSLAR